MTLRSEFADAGRVYAARAEADRLGALVLEARHENNAAAFAAAIGAALNPSTETNTEETPA